MRYVDKDTQKIPTKHAPKCLKNWIWTIQAAQAIWHRLSEAGFESLNLKSLNQDVIENFFNQLRSNGCANRNPTCEQFEGAFKTLFVGNLTSKHLFGANCEENTEGTTLAFSHLMNVSAVNKEINDVEEIDTVECTESAIPNTNINEKIINEQQIVNIIKRNNIIAQCKHCVNTLADAQTLNHIRQAIDLLEFKFIEICHETKVMEKTMTILENQCFSSYSQHCTHFKETSIIIIAQEFVKAWCKFINNILCRKIDILHSDTFMYKLAKRLSTKYTKKISDTKIEIRL